MWDRPLYFVFYVDRRLEYVADVLVWFQFFTLMKVCVFMQRSRTVFQERSPRWGDKLDFVLVSVLSLLHITVFSQVSLLRRLLNMGQQHQEHPGGGASGVRIIFWWCIDFA